MILFVDTETTGLDPRAGAKLVEIAALDGAGTVKIDTLLDPGVAIPDSASAIHGIRDADVAGKPRLEDLTWFADLLAQADRVVFYNAAFDTAFLPPGWLAPSKVHCAMMRFSAYRDSLGQGARWAKLDQAASWARHQWTGEAHRALADAAATKSVWEYLAREFPCLPGYPATIDGYAKAHADWRELDKRRRA